ncbi:hypothetical protein COHA_007470 [Chlorella ohadii]|uniref:DUF1990 domain-containing protein n=1 Tax=Chlorella ohadii TaxID=2649997 RepID=A0AAD5DII0_9CHLO|nr:hypothetical protein COHA_007470 [Chlorella ohadii]
MAALCSVAALGGARLAPSRSSTSSSEQRAARAGRVLVRAAAADGRDATGLSSLRFGKPSQGDMDALMQEWRSRECNHDYAGESFNAPSLPAEVKGGGFMVTTNRKKIGEGKKVFDAAVKAVKSWQHLQLGWNCTTAPAMQNGATICSATQTVVPWSVLPAQVVYCNESAAEFGPGNKGRRFAVGLCSLNGHQLAGEERFQVELHADGSVWYDIFLFSRPDTLLAWASLPVVKLQQIRYVNDGIAAVAKAVKA